MKDLLYVMLLEKTAIYKKMNKEAVIRHVDNIKKLDDDGNLELCGVLRKCPSFAGMVILKAESYEEAEELCKREPMVAPITDKEYFVRGSTALLDAIGRTIDKIDNAQKRTAEDERAEKVMVVITTDGMENASREYKYDKIKAMIERQKEKHGWEFLFIGANIDAVETASKFGISAECAANYHADSQGTSVVYDAVCETVCCMRAEPSAKISAAWKKQIDEDFESRK